MTELVKQFDGDDYQFEFDYTRLTGQLGRVYSLMKDGRWRTLDEIHQETGDPHASISAQLRNLRKDRFGGHSVFRRTRGDRRLGLYEYRVEI